MKAFAWQTYHRDTKSRTANSICRDIYCAGLLGVRESHTNMGNSMAGHTDELKDSNNKYH
jgi:hypothetical protein